MAAPAAFEATTATPIAPVAVVAPAIPVAPVYLNRSGFDEVVTNTFGLTDGVGHIFNLDADLLDYVWHLTSGHAQAVGLVFQALADHFVSIRAFLDDENCRLTDGIYPEIHQLQDSVLDYHLRRC